MTDLLLRLFVRNAADTDNPATRSAIGKMSGLVGIICNLLLSAGKLAVGTISGSVAITADALNNLSDAASSIVTLLGFKLAEKPADADHPYGHARFEYLSGLAVAVLIILIGFELAKTSVGKIMHPEAVEFSVATVLVLLASIGVKLWMCLFNNRLGKRIGSSTLTATAADSRNDVVATGAVLIAALVQHVTSWQIDGWIGFAVALFILYSGWNLAKETISPLLGEGADPALRQLIVDYVEASPKVLGYHDLMVHDYGPGQRFASLHVEMDQREDPLLCHELIDNMERTCLQLHNIHLVIHYDPVVVGDPETDKLRLLLWDVLRKIDDRLTIHDFRMVKGKGHTNLIFDVALPYDMKGQEKQLRRAMENALAELHQGTYYIVVTFDPEAFNQ